MQPSETAIRAKRKLTNRLIAARDALRLRPHLTNDMLMIAGDGGLIEGADAVVTAFLSQFANPSFITYVRTTETVEVSAQGDRGAETGRWVGHWKDQSDIAGVYLAAWRENLGQWRLERELYITLKRWPQGPPL